jgi:hypothetical protein
MPLMVERLHQRGLRSPAQVRLGRYGKSDGDCKPWFTAFQYGCRAQEVEPVGVRDGDPALHQAKMIAERERGWPYRTSKNWELPLARRPLEG